MPNFESLSREELQLAVADLGFSLAELSLRLEELGGENLLLGEESALLKDAIDSKLEDAADKERAGLARAGFKARPASQHPASQRGAAEVARQEGGSQRLASSLGREGHERRQREHPLDSEALRAADQAMRDELFGP
mmetsp:Transcript_75238/g.193996  ORF Transcript_75238/g.193996 Transcript_75238/m.193996 type:complete len:137 (-) Transcript_75238:6-416(-)